MIYNSESQDTVATDTRFVLQSYRKPELQI